jgi:hypothetical protein
VAHSSTYSSTLALVASLLPLWLTQALTAPLLHLWSASCPCGVTLALIAFLLPLDITPQVLQPALLMVAPLQHLDLSHCCLTDASAEGLAALVRNQSRRAMEQAWIQGLRYYDQGQSSGSSSRRTGQQHCTANQGPGGIKRVPPCGLEVLQLEGNLVRGVCNRGERVSYLNHWRLITSIGSC